MIALPPEFLSAFFARLVIAIGKTDQPLAEKIRSYCGDKVPGAGDTRRVISISPPASAAYGLLKSLEVYFEQDGASIFDTGTFTPTIEAV